MTQLLLRTLLKRFHIENESSHNTYLQKKRQATVKDGGLVIKKKKVKGNTVPGRMTYHLTDVPRHASL